MLCPSIVGRKREIATIDATLQQALGGTGSSIFLVGDAGVGKSRLIRDVTMRVRAHGGVVLVGRSTPSDSGTLRALREALLAAARAGVAPGPSALGAYLPILGALVPDWAEHATGQDVLTVEIGEAFVRFLCGVVQQPIVLVLEDLHWADNETLAVIEYVAEHINVTPALLIASGRPGCAAEALSTSLAARRATRVINLETLDPVAVDEMLRSTLDVDELPEGLSALVNDRAEGLPFYVEEVLASLVAGGQLHQLEDTWSLDRTREVSVPAAAMDAVRSRAAALDADTRLILQHAAVLGRRFDWTLLDELFDQKTLTRALRECTRSQFLDHVGDEFRFRHALTCDALVSDLTPADRAAAARRLLAVVEQRHPRLDRGWIEIAVDLAVQANEVDRAADLLTRVGVRDLRAGLLGSAELRLRRAIDLASCERRRSEIEATHVEVLAKSGQTAAAIESGRVLLERAETDGVTGERAIDVRLAMARAACTGGRWGDVDELLEQIAASDDPNPRRSASAALIAAVGGVGRHDLVMALAGGERALGLALGASMWDVACEALRVIGQAQRFTDLDTAEATFERARQLARRHGLMVHEADAIQELGTIDLYNCGSLDRLHEARIRAERLGSLSTVAVVDLQRAALHVERFELNEALEAAEKSIATAARLQLGTLEMGHAIAAMAHARRPDRHAMEASLAMMNETRTDPLTEAVAWGHVRAMFHLAVDDIDAAAEALDRAVELLDDFPHTALPFEGLWALVRTVTDCDGERARRRVASRSATNPSNQLHLRCAEAIAAGRNGDVETADSCARYVEEQFDGRQGQQWTRHLAHRLMAPDALADGWGRPVAWLRVAIPDFEASGHRLLATACRRVLGDAGAPVPRQGRGDSFVPGALAELGITSRETDVMTLVADGLTNVSIARRLHLSPRTVEKHVEQLLRKSGRPRVELAELARVTGLIAGSSGTGRG